MKFFTICISTQLNNKNKKDSYKPTKNNISFNRLC